MSLKWEYKRNLDAYFEKQQANLTNLKTVYDELAAKARTVTSADSTAAATDNDKSLAIKDLFNKANAGLQPLVDHLNKLKNTLNFKQVNRTDLGAFMDDQKSQYLQKLESAYNDRKRAINGLDSLKPEEKKQLEDALEKHHEEEKKAANEHFEKAKKDLEEYNHALGRMDSFGYVQAKILPRTGFEGESATVGSDNKAIKAFEEFQNGALQKIKIGGFKLEIGSFDKEGKMTIQLPPPILIGSEKKFAEEFIKTMHAKGCDTISFSGNVSDKLKREMWLAGQLAIPKINVAYAVEKKDQDELGRKAAAIQQAQAPTANTTPTTPTPGRS